MNEGKTKFISLAKAAKLTKYKQDYLGLLCRQGKLKGEKIGRNWVTTKEWVLKYVEKIESKGEEIIPVKVIEPREEREEIKAKKFSIGYPKMVSAVLAISVIVAASSFIFINKNEKLENSWNDKRVAAEFVILDALEHINSTGEKLGNWEIGIGSENNFIKRFPKSY